MTPDQRIARLAADSFGLIRRQDAVRLGLSRHQIGQRIRSGRWEAVRPGVYRMAGVPPSPEQALAAATLATGGVASHRSAAWLLELGNVPRLPEVTADRSTSHGHDGLRLHRTTDLLPRDTTSVRGLRCTNATRTCIDLGARLDADALEALVHTAIRLRLTHPDHLITRFLQIARRGRAGCATTRQVLQRIDPTLEPAESDLETLLIQVLRRFGVPLPVRQFPVLVDGRKFRLDFAYPDLMVAIESDGFAVHGDRSSFEHDRERQNRLVLQGWRILRFTWRQICGRPEWVARQVQAAIDRHGGAAFHLGL